MTLTRNPRQSGGRGSQVPSRNRRPSNVQTIVHQNRDFASQHIHQPHSHDDAVSANYAFFQEAGSPGSTSTNASWCLPGSYGSSFASEPTQLLGYQRDLSPIALTPASSEASFNGYEIASEINDYQHYPYVPPQDHQQGHAVVEVNSYHQPLRCLDTSPSESRKRPFAPRGAFAPPLVHNPVRLEPSPPRVDTWSPYPFRYENPGAAVRHVSSANRRRRFEDGELGHIHHTSTVGPYSSNPLPDVLIGNVTAIFAGPAHPAAPKTAQRSQPLTDQQKVKASKVRKLGACLRCRLFKEPCDENTPCGRCGSLYRKWDLACTRKGPKDRLEYLQPDLFVSNLREGFDSFMNDRIFDFDTTFQPSFDLQVTTHLGQPLKIRVKAFEPMDQNLFERNAFQVFFYGHTYAQYEKVKLRSPPVLPDFSLQSEEGMLLKESIRKWAENLVRHMKEDPTELPGQYFLKDEYRWERGILTKICEYYNSNIPEHAALKDALMMALLNFLMTRTLAVPKGQLEQLYEFIKDSQYPKDTSTECSPFAVNRFVKILAHQLSEEYSRITLARLQSALLERSELAYKKDLVFCLAFISLMTLSRTQVAVISKAQRGDCTMHEAKEEVRTMEKEFADHVIALSHYRFTSNQKFQNGGLDDCSETEAYSGQFQLFRKLDLRKPRRHYRDSDVWMTGVDVESDEDKKESYELGEIDEFIFGAVNSRRLLKKFCRTVFGK